MYSFSAQISRTPLYSDYLINGTLARKYGKGGQAIQMPNMPFRKKDHHCKLRTLTGILGRAIGKIQKCGEGSSSI